MVDANITNITSAVTPIQPTDYTLPILICAALLLAIVAGFLWWTMRKNKVPKTIPPEVQKEFERAEELTLKYKGAVTPQSILWQINEERNNLYTLTKDEYKDTPQQVQPQPTQTKPRKIGFLFKRKV